MSFATVTIIMACLIIMGSVALLSLNIDRLINDLEGQNEVVAFVDGKLFIDGKPHYEPYVKFVCDWNLPPRRVEPDHYYVVGDNRSMPMGNHIFGSVARRRIEGVPTW